MKRHLCIVLTVLALILTSACDNNSDNFKEPANFYYTNATVSFFEAESVIAPEVRETVDQNGNITDIINVYLSGPISDKLTSPFPAGLSIISAQRTKDTYSLTFNKQFSSLSGLDLTIACSCICATVAELTNCNTVEIIYEGQQSQNTSPLTFSYDSLLFLDSVN